MNRSPKVREKRWLKSCASFFVLAASTFPVRAEFTGGPPLGEVVCGSLSTSGFGPFDLRTIPAQHKLTVERAHFPPHVEMLQRGHSATIGGDLDYTLRMIPNHHRALASMSRLTEKIKQDPAPGAKFRTECYFDRGIRLAPDDARLYVVYADWLTRIRRAQEARLALTLSEKYGADDPLVNYNSALIWLDLKEPDRALALARRAYAGGIQLDGLRKRLLAEGRQLD